MTPTTPPQFDYQPRTRVVCGPGCVDQLGQLVVQCGGQRVLLVTDAGLVSAGHAAHATAAMQQCGLTVVLFDQVAENPTTRIVEACVGAARDANVDFLVGLGGGSSMDTAKGCNFLLTSGGKMEDYRGVGKASKPMLPLIAVPTTTGTGSECQSFALITHAETHVKMACGDPKAAATVAILDPQLAVSQPREVAFCTGIDALSHAVESAVTKRRSAVSQVFSREAFRLCIHALPQVLSGDGDLAAFGRLQLGAAWAGTAIENSMLGAAHAAANPLTRHFGLPHGLAVGFTLPHVVELNGAVPEADTTYRELLQFAGLDSATDGPTHVLASELRRCMQLLPSQHMIPAVTLDANTIEQLAEEAAAQWTAQFNPRPLAVADFVRLYEKIDADFHMTVTGH